MGQGSGGENVLGSGTRLEGLNQNGGLTVIQPLIPVAHWKMFVLSDVVFACLALGGNLLIGLIVRGVGIDQGLEQDGVAVRPPLGIAGAGGNAGEAACFAALGEIENVDLLRLVAFALGGESDAGAVGRPDDVILRGLGVGQAARRLESVGGYEPQIADRLVGFVGRFHDRKDRPL